MPNLKFSAYLLRAAIILLVYGLGLLAGIYFGKAGQTPIEPHKLKQGFTLFTWNGHSGELCFVIVPQYKSMEFVENPFHKWGGQCGVSRLEEELSALPKASSVEWVNWQAFPYPSDDLVSQVLRFAKSKEVELHLNPVLR